jgi:TrmH family RNA methyltransferase
MITSTQNTRIKYVRSLARRRVRQREGRFLVEGNRLVSEVVRGGIEPVLVLYTESWLAAPHAEGLLASLPEAGEGAWLVSEAVLAACADTQAPQGILAVVPFIQLRPGPGLVLIVDRLRDPGNLGTMLRSAEAAGVGEVLLAPDTVDHYNPKVVRGAMGAHLSLAVAALDWPDIGERVRGRTVWLADAGGEVAYDAVDWTQPSALIVGGEAHGAGKQAGALATGRVSIPMAGGAESLNAAMAATVILFEVARQRRGQPPLPQRHSTREHA